MPEFCRDQSAYEVHSALKSALQALEKAQQCAVLWFGEILDRKLYRELGYSSINQYAEVELGFSTTRTYDFIMLCGKLKKLPKVKAKVESGELGYTAARVLVPILDKTNEEGWLNFALHNSRRDLEQEVKRSKKEAADKAAGQPSLIAAPTRRPAAVVPVRLNIEMSPSQFARYEKLWEQIRRQGKSPADKVVALLEMMAAYVSCDSPRGNHQRPPKSTSTNAPTAPKPPSRPARANWSSAQPQKNAPNATAESAVPANATQLPSRRQRDARSSPTAATSASVRDVTTRISWKCTTRFRVRREGRMRPIISSVCVPHVIAWCTRIKWGFS